MSSLTAARARTKRPLGIVLWEGPSRIDGAPIVVIATGFKRKTKNAKTGNMVQSWIIRSDIAPTVAINTGDDASICGSCPLRGILESQDDGSTRNRMRACYVSVRNAPRAIFEAYCNGSYDTFAPHHLDLFRGRMLRLGAYGDPVAAPYATWKPLVDAADGHTGYSHQWRVGRFWRFRRIVMASVESLAQAKQARSRGWRTFRTMQHDEETVRGEFRCPASAEEGKRLTCEQCGACDGSSFNSNRASVTILAHGSPAVIGSYKRLLTS
jgi:hypothetical protein